MHEHTSSGTSLLILSCTVPTRLPLFAKFTKYFNEKVRLTACDISIETPPVSPSSLDFFDFFMPPFFPVEVEGRFRFFLFELSSSPSSSASEPPSDSTSDTGA